MKEKSNDWLLGAAEFGSAEAMFELGNRVVNNELDDDHGTAVEWFEKAADLGHEAAKQAFVREMDEVEDSTDEQEQKLVEILAELAESGDFDAALQVAELQPTREHHEILVQAFMNPDTQLDSDAHIGMGYYYLRGPRFALDYELAARQFRKAIELDIEDAQDCAVDVELIKLALMGRTTFDSREISNLIKAHVQIRGESQISVDLAEVVRSDFDIENQDQIIVFLLEAAIDGAEPDASHEAAECLGKYYLDKDQIEVALKYLRLAASISGPCEAQLILGRMYWWGEGVEIDPFRAKDWLKKAAPRFVEAAQLLGP